MSMKQADKHSQAFALQGSVQVDSTPSGPCYTVMKGSSKDTQIRGSGAVVVIALSCGLTCCTDEALFT